MSTSAILSYSSEPRPPFPEIDTTDPESTRSSFRSTSYDDILPSLRARFPNVGVPYFLKIFRGTIRPIGLIWLDVGMEDAPPADFHNLAHMLYCFEVYGQIICMLASPQGLEKEMELQWALADYRMRILKLSKVCTFESLRKWHEAILDAQMRDGQDRTSGWREQRAELEGLLKQL